MFLNHLENPYPRLAQLSIPILFHFGRGVLFEEEFIMIQNSTKLSVQANKKSWIVLDKRSILFNSCTQCLMRDLSKCQSADKSELLANNVFWCLDFLNFLQVKLWVPEEISSTFFPPEILDSVLVFFWLGGVHSVFSISYRESSLQHTKVCFPRLNALWNIMTVSINTRPQWSSSTVHFILDTQCTFSLLLVQNLPQRGTRPALQVILLATFLFFSGLPAIKNLP